MLQLQELSDRVFELTHVGHLNTQKKIVKFTYALNCFETNFSTHALTHTLPIPRVWPVPYAYDPSSGSNGQQLFRQ